MSLSTVTCRAIVKDGRNIIVHGARDGILIIRLTTIRLLGRRASIINILRRMRDHFLMDTVIRARIRQTIRRKVRVNFQGASNVVRLCARVLRS